MASYPPLLEAKAISAESGDHVGCISNSGLSLVNCVIIPFCKSRTQISGLPFRSEVKATFFPSGEIAGSLSLAGSVVSFSSSVPLTFIIQISQLPLLSEANTTFSIVELGCMTTAPAFIEMTAVKTLIVIVTIMEIATILRPKFSFVFSSPFMFVYILMSLLLVVV